MEFLINKKNNIKPSATDLWIGPVWDLEWVRSTKCLIIDDRYNGHSLLNSAYRAIDDTGKINKTERVIFPADYGFVQLVAAAFVLENQKWPQPIPTEIKERINNLPYGSTRTLNEAAQQGWPGLSWMSKFSDIRMQDRVSMVGQWLKEGEIFLGSDSNHEISDMLGITQLKKELGSTILALDAQVRKSAQKL